MDRSKWKENTRKNTDKKMMALLPNFNQCKMLI